MRRGVRASCVWYARMIRSNRVVDPPQHPKAGTHHGHPCPCQPLLLRGEVSVVFSDERERGVGGQSVKGKCVLVGPLVLGAWRRSKQAAAGIVGRGFKSRGQRALVVVVVVIGLELLDRVWLYRGHAKACLPIDRCSNQSTQQSQRDQSRRFGLDGNQRGCPREGAKNNNALSMGLPLADWLDHFRVEV